MILAHPLIESLPEHGARGIDAHCRGWVITAIRRYWLDRIEIAGSDVLLHYEIFLDNKEHRNTLPLGKIHRQKIPNGEGGYKVQYNAMSYIGDELPVHVGFYDRQYKAMLAIIQHIAQQI